MTSIAVGTEEKLSGALGTVTELWTCVARCGLHESLHGDGDIGPITHPALCE